MRDVCVCVCVCVVLSLSFIIDSFSSLDLVSFRNIPLCQSVSVSAYMNMNAFITDSAEYKWVKSPLAQRYNSYFPAQVSAVFLSKSAEANWDANQNTANYSQYNLMSEHEIA